MDKRILLGLANIIAWSFVAYKVIVDATVLIDIVLILTFFFSYNFFFKKYRSDFLFNLGKFNSILFIFLIFFFPAIFIFDIKFMKPVGTFLFIYSVMNTIYIWWASRLIKPKPIRGTFAQKIKHRLGLTKIVTKEVKFNKNFNWIGGFVTPLFPFFTVTNTNWKKGKRYKEAIIHENIHLHYFIYRGWGLLFMVFFIFVIPLLLNTFNTQLYVLFVNLSLTLILIFNEFLTFTKTRKIGKEYNLDCGPFTWKLFKKYFIIYMSWMFLVRFFIDGVVFVLTVGISWLVYLL